jgi:ligand-binding SRPBCC domain-containing protein
VTGEHTLATEMFVPRPRLEVFQFFAAAENLERITPPELNFEIVTPAPIRLAAGTVIDYRLRLFGLCFLWRTLISRWEPGDLFVDEQVKGPYASWVHTHSFRDAGNGTMVHDHVRYRLPLFPVGELAYPIVRLQLKRIFAYRAMRLRETFGSSQ